MHVHPKVDGATQSQGQAAPAHLRHMADIGDLQRADLELSVLLNYRVETEAFIELLNEIEAKAGRGESVSSNREAGPQAHTTASGDSWSSELQTTLVGLSNHCKHRLEHHLDIIKLDDLREVLKMELNTGFEISDADFQPKKMVVRVVGEAKYSSSAIDVATFLHQMVKFWKELDWPDVEECFPFSLLHLQTFIWRLVINSWLARIFTMQVDSFLLLNRFAILFNNMAHIKSQLDTLVKGLGVESLCERMKDRAESTVQTLDNLKRSTVEDINNKIFKALHKFSKMLAPDIITFIKSIMASGDVTSSTEVLLEFLTKNLKTFSEYLLDDVFHKVLQCVWSVTITSAQSALRSGTQSQTECSQLSATLQVLKEFFNADGNGLTDKKLESEEYMFSSSQKSLGPLQLESSSFSIVYLEQKSALEVNILNAKLVNGDRYKKDGSADTFVQAWLLPQMVFHDCSKASYKTDLKKGTLNPVYYKEVHLPAQLEDLRSDGAILVLAVYFTDMKRIAGLCVVPCKDVPVLKNESGRKKITLPLFLAKMHNNGPLKELKDRQTLQDPELTDLYLHLVKKLYASLPN
eukprot:Em0020g912a